MKYMLFIGSMVFIHDVAANRSQRIHSEQMLQKLKMLVLWCTCTVSKNIVNRRCEKMSLCKSVSTCIVLTYFTLLNLSVRLKKKWNLCFLTYRDTLTIQPPV